MKELTAKLGNGLDLTPSDIAYAVTLLFSEKVDDANKAEFLTALHEKGESADEIFGFHQDSNFYYLTGWIEPGAALLIARREVPLGYGGDENPQFEHPK